MPGGIATEVGDNVLKELYCENICEVVTMLSPLHLVEVDIIDTK